MKKEEDNDSINEAVISLGMKLDSWLILKKAHTIMVKRTVINRPIRIQAMDMKFVDIKYSGDPIT